MLPEISFEETQTEKLLKDKTVRIDFDKKCLCEEIEGTESLEQAIRMALLTERYIYPIFSHNYGTDYKNAFNEEFSRAMGKIKNGIEDSLLSDDRILSVSDFEFERLGKKIAVKFKVASIYGQLDYYTEVE